MFLPALALSESCHRGQARMARQIFSKTYFAVLAENGYAVPPSCPLSPERDVYAKQESHKYYEPPNRYYCQFCGKGFYDERFIDQHFDNRHSDKLVANNAACLADYCDIARCDVVIGKRVSNFWDVAMCRDGDALALHNKCMELMRQCVPPNIGKSDTLLDQLNSSLCAQLYCDSYWDVVPEEDLSGPIVFYVLLTLFISSSILVYYCIMCSHFLSLEERQQEERWRAQQSPDAQWQQQNVFRFPSPVTAQLHRRPVSSPVN